MSNDFDTPPTPLPVRKLRVDTPEPGPLPPPPEEQRRTGRLPAYRGDAEPGCSSLALWALVAVQLGWFMWTVLHGR